MLTTDTSTSPAAVPLPADRSVRGETVSRWIILGICLAVVVLSMGLSLSSEPGDVIVPLLNRPLPPLCTMKRLTGVDCPGCGLTRSFIALAHGQWRESLRFNAAGPIWFVIIAGQVPFQAWQLRRIASQQRPLDVTWWGQAVIYTGVATLLLQWLGKMIF